jgi:hypothetical protein
MQKRRVAEHREGPLVRVTDKRNPGVLEHPSSAGGQSEPGVLLGRNLAGADDLTLRHPLLHKRVRESATPGCQRFAIHGVKHSTFPDEHPRSVTERSRVELHRQLFGTGMPTPADEVVAAAFNGFRNTGSRGSGQRRLNLRIPQPPPAATNFPRLDRSRPAEDSFFPFQTQEPVGRVVVPSPVAVPRIVGLCLPQSSRENAKTHDGANETDAECPFHVRFLSL